MKSFFINIFVASVLYGCGGGGTSQVVPPERISGIIVPAQPDATANSLSIGGIDSDNNGIRDDIDRKIAFDSGSNPQDYANAVTHAKSLQKAISNITATNSAAHVAVIACKESATLQKMALVTRATLDTTSRRNAYAEAFAGSEISNEACTK